MVECIDITERREAETRMTQYAEELKDQIETKNKFFSIIANDLRNPFNSLMTISNLLIEQFEKLNKEKSLEYIGIISGSAKKGYQLLENLLEWLRMQTGTISFNPGQVELKTVVDDAIEIEAINLRNKQIEIASLIDNKLIFLRLQHGLHCAAEFDFERM